MNKTEFIKKYGEAAYDKHQEVSNRWKAANKKRERATGKQWRLLHPEKVKQVNKETSRKGGKYYEQHKQYKKTGLQYEKLLVRQKHQRIWTPFKRIIAPDSILHHEWLPDTPDYRGVALVEKDQHQHGFIDVIQILEGEITLLTEADIRGI